LIARAPVVALTLRGLLDRRRFWLMVALAAMPVVVIIAATLLADAPMSDARFDQLFIRTVLPLVALVFGTGALGSEIDEGTIVYLLTKPMRRSRIALAKGLVAAGMTTALLVPATLLTGLIGTRAEITELGSTLAYAVAIAIGGSAYALAFMTLSSFTSRALAVGLGYVLIWEGILGGLLEGTRLFSIRQATLGLANGLLGVDDPDTLDVTTAAVVLGVVIVGALLLASWRLSRYQVRGGD
jgi:ABC-2 type transport system permease protein